jgi:hypothetical protein
MSISVFCDECGHEYQVRNEMAGRRGKCPKGHSIQVPVDAAAETQVEDNAFAFTSSPVAEAAAPKSARRQPVRPEPQIEPVATAVHNDFSAFPTQLAGSASRDEEAPKPKTGRHRRPDRAAAKEGKPSLMPLILGGILALLGIGGGVTLLIVSRGEAGPLREQADAANKKATAAEERAQKAESLKLLAETNLETAKKNPPRDPALAETQTKLKAAEKRATEAERKLTELAKGRDVAGGDAAMPSKDLDPNGPGGKNDPVMPGGKLEMDRAKGKAMDKKEMDKKETDKKEMDRKEMEKAAAKKDADKPAAPDMAVEIPDGGKNWNVPGSLKVGTHTLKAGDRIWLWPKQDAILKASGGKLSIAFRWSLRKGKELPPKAGATLVVQDAKAMKTFAKPITLTGANGEMEIVFDHKELKDIKGSLPVFFFIGDGRVDNPTVSSSMLGLQVEFAPSK